MEGLASGADDYLVKPFSARELMARVRVQLEMSSMRAEVWREHAQVEALRRSIVARDELISISSHELRTPLTALQMQLESLLGLSEKGRLENDRQRVTNKLSLALRQVGRLHRLVESLLDALRVSQGALTLAREEFELAELAQGVLARWEEDALADGSRLVLHGHAVRGSWDRARIQ